MNNIEEKLAAKQAEHAAAAETQRLLWSDYQEADKVMLEKRNKWNDALNHQRALELELKILEGVLNEMAAA